MSRPDSRPAAWDPVTESPPVDPAALPPHVWIRLHDRQRVLRKLRISLTEHCNLRCFFCHNEGQGPILRSAQRSPLGPHEIETVVRVALSEGVRKIKLTGGEPLLYRSGPDDIVSLVHKIAKLRSNTDDFDLSLTTNGSLMPEYARRLAAAGLDRATLSLTTLNEGTFGSLISPNTGLLARTMAGLGAARDAGLAPLKVNMVLYYSPSHGVGNLSEIRDMLAVVAAYGVTELRLFTLLWHDRFSRFGEFYHFFSPEMRTELEALLDLAGVVAPVATVEVLSGLATMFAHRMYPKVEFGVDLGSVKLGFEAMKFGRLPADAGLQEGPYAIRLGADGGLRTTLNGAASYDLVSGVRNGLDDVELRRLFRAAVREMP